MEIHMGRMRSSLEQKVKSVARKTLISLATLAGLAVVIIAPDFLLTSSYKCNEENPSWW